MKPQEFKDEILNHYIDSDFQITVLRDPFSWSTGNGLLHTALFYTILHRFGLITAEDKNRFAEAVDLCWTRSDRRAILGLLNRNYNRPDFEGHDDYHIVTASNLLDTYHAEAVYNYGDMTDWSYNNETPFNKSWLSLQYWRGWHARFIGRIGYYAMAAGVLPSDFDRLLICLDLRLGPSINSSTVMMQWLRVQVYKKLPEGFGQQIKAWENKFREKHGSLSNALTGYFGKGHPFTDLEGIDV